MWQTMDSSGNLDTSMEARDDPVAQEPIPTIELDGRPRDKEPRRGPNRRLIVFNIALSFAIGVWCFIGLAKGSADGIWLCLVISPLLLALAQVPFCLIATLVVLFIVEDTPVGRKRTWTHDECDFLIDCLSEAAYLIMLCVAILEIR